jgi:N-methylhydantoinase B
MRSSGGGGYGDPLERDAEQVQQDVADGYISRDRAASGYGVVFKDGEVDVPATERQRAVLRQRCVYLTVVPDEVIETYTGAKGRRRIVYLHEQDAARRNLQVDDLLELLGRNPAPLRAWVRLGRSAPGQVRLDEFARRVLGVRPGDLVQVRALKTPVVAKGLAG